MSRATVPSKEEFSVIEKEAEALLASGFLPQSIKKPQQVIAIMMLGRELNIPAWQALNGIHVIQGKPTISPQLMLALIERSGQLEDLCIKGDSQYCEVMMKRKGRATHKEIFTLADAKRMKLADKMNWKQQPSVMLKWRAVSACARVVFPDVLMGLYNTEELAPDLVEINDYGEAVYQGDESCQLSPNLKKELEISLQTEMMVELPVFELKEINEHLAREEKKAHLIKKKLEALIQQYPRGLEWLTMYLKKLGLTYRTMDETQYKQTKAIISKLSPVVIEKALKSNSV